ncbi:MAG: flagellar basal-body rod protein FlgF [Clostridiales bacterium GWD2_32_19]|nr:MAG: flagellar basal-body rod protein FlgF [Clostridiales bacterium GWD2_32_19]
MIRGLYTSATGMVTQSKLLDTVSNNLANADTTGFKKDTLVVSSFKDELTKRIGNNDNKTIGGMKMGVYGDQTYTNFMQGSLKQTGNKLDFSIKGDGFFTIETKDANGNKVERLTRNGSFTLNENKQLVTTDGDAVIDENGEHIFIPDREVYILDNDGRLFLNNEKIAKLKVVNIENPETLRKSGSSMFTTTQATKFTEFNGEVMQGYTETSNVNIIKEMVDMINITRNFETNQKLLQIHDQLLSKSANEIGKV